MSQSILKKVIGTMLLMLVMACMQSLIAQDKIISKKGDEILCTITRITDTHIEYLDPQEEFYKIEKKYIKEVEFSKDPRNPIDHSNNTSKAIKFNLLSLLNNSLQFSYEKALDPLSSIEVTFRIFGISVKDFPEEKKGGGIDIGYRFRLGDFVNGNRKIDNSHVLDGIGVKPTVGGSYAQLDIENAQEKYYYVHIGTVINYQVAFKNRILFEAYGGVHIYKGKNTIDFSNTATRKGVLDFEDGDLNGSDNVAYSFGIKVGYLFGGFDRDARLLRW